MHSINPISTTGTFAGTTPLAETTADHKAVRRGRNAPRRDTESIDAYQSRITAHRLADADAARNRRAIKHGKILEDITDAYLYGAPHWHTPQGMDSAPFADELARKIQAYVAVLPQRETATRLGADILSLIMGEYAAKHPGYRASYKPQALPYRSNDLAVSTAPSLPLHERFNANRTAPIRAWAIQSKMLIERHWYRLLSACGKISKSSPQVGTYDLANEPRYTLYLTDSETPLDKFIKPTDKRTSVDCHKVRSIGTAGNVGLSKGWTVSEVIDTPHGERYKVYRLAKYDKPIVVRVVDPVEVIDKPMPARYRTNKPDALKVLLGRHGMALPLTQYQEWIADLRRSSEETDIIKRLKASNAVKTPLSARDAAYKESFRIACCKRAMLQAARVERQRVEALVRTPIGAYAYDSSVHPEVHDSMRGFNGYCYNR